MQKVCSYEFSKINKNIITSINQIMETLSLMVLFLLIIIPLLNFYYDILVADKDQREVYGVFEVVEEGSPFILMSQIMQHSEQNR